MEIWGMIAVGFFTLAGVILSSFLQQRGMKEHRKNILNDEARKFKRELMGSRLEKAEEQIKLMARVISVEINKIMGEPSALTRRDDWDNLSPRIESNNSEAWTAVHIVGSEKLKKNYQIIITIYWNFMRDGRLTQDTDEWEKVTKAEIEAIKIMDNLRAFGNEDGNSSDESVVLGIDILDSFKQFVKRVRRKYGVIIKNRKD